MTESFRLKPRFAFDANFGSRWRWEVEVWNYQRWENQTCLFLFRGIRSFRTFSKGILFNQNKIIIKVGRLNDFERWCKKHIKFKKELNLGQWCNWLRNHSRFFAKWNSTGCSSSNQEAVIIAEMRGLKVDQMESGRCKTLANLKSCPTGHPKQNCQLKSN